MRTPLRRLAPAVAFPAVALAVTLLAGCGGSPPRAAAGSAASAPASTGTGSPAGASTGTDSPDPAGRTLTAAEARAVVPPAAVLPAGWRVDRDRGLPSPLDATATIDPPRCQALFDQLHRTRETTNAAIAASAEGSFRARDAGPFLTVTVESYGRPAAAGLFDRAATALADCPRFTGTIGGVAADFRASPLNLPRLGDETLSLRFIGTTGARPFTLDFVAIRVGHNSITAQQVSLGATADAQVLQRAATAALRRLPDR
jgi:hypothetical protein